MLAGFQNAIAQHTPGNINLTIANTGPVPPGYQRLMAEAAQWLNVALNDPNFQSMVKGKEYDSQKLSSYYYFPRGTSSIEVFEALFNNKTTDITIYFELSPAQNRRYKRFGTLGITTLKGYHTKTMTYWLDTTFSSSEGAKEYASHLAHEYCHMVGFSDRKRRPSGHRNVVPYAIGDMVKTTLAGIHQLPALPPVPPPVATAISPAKQLPPASVLMEMNSIVPPVNAGIPLIDCADIAKTIGQAGRDKAGDTVWSRQVTLPAEGHFVMESHYVTNQDQFPNKLFPATDNENIQEHLDRSLRLYQRFSPTATMATVYPLKYAHVWTPSEGGDLGQGSMGNRQLTMLSPTDELWLMTMNWAKGQRPAPGTRFLLSANGRQVVVMAGYETGPANQRWLGGVTPEVYAWLQLKPGTIVRVAYLKDQLLPAGPCGCK